MYWRPFIRFYKYKWFRRCVSDELDEMDGDRWDEDEGAQADWGFCDLLLGFYSDLGMSEWKCHFVIYLCRFHKFYACFIKELLLWFKSYCKYPPMKLFQ